MKKTLALILTLIVLLSVCSCEYPDTEPTEEKGTEQVPTGAPVLADFGEVSENEYKNEYLGIRWAFGEGWMFYPEADLRIASEIDLEAEGEELKAALNEAGSIADMFGFIYNENETCSAGVVIENRVGRPIEISDYINNEIEAKKIFFATTGQSDVVMETKKTVFLGAIYDSIIYTSSTSYQVSIIWKIDERIVTLSIVAPSEARASEILAEFSSIR